jgi:hypothetical protein
MKTEHRKELQTNILADRMGKLLQSMKTAPRSSSMLIWVFAVLIVGTYALWQYYAHAAFTERSKLWTDLGVAIQDSDTGWQRLPAFAQANPGSIAGRAARFELARIRLQQGLESLGSPSEREAAIKQLVETRREYKTLAAECPDAPLLAQEARMAVATVEESLDGVPDPENPGTTHGSLQLAVAQYRELAAEYPDSPMGKIAAGRAQAIERDRAQVEKFYVELNQVASPKEKPDARKQLEGLEKEITEGTLKNLMDEQKDKLRQAGKEIEQQLKQLPDKKNKPEAKKQ